MSWLARLSTSMQEVRIVYAASKPHSAGTIRFIKKHYQQIKRLNPRLPFLVRPHEEVPKPELFARYDYGGFARRDLTDLNETEIMEKLRELQELGNIALKADIYPWQESSKQDKDVIDYDKTDPNQHHL